MRKFFKKISSLFKSSWFHKILLGLWQSWWRILFFLLFLVITLHFSIYSSNSPVQLLANFIETTGHAGTSTPEFFVLSIIQALFFVLVSFLLATVDLHPDWAHRMLFLIQIPTLLLLFLISVIGVFELNQIAAKSPASHEKEARAILYGGDGFSHGRTAYFWHYSTLRNNEYLTDFIELTDIVKSSNKNEKSRTILPEFGKYLWYAVDRGRNQFIEDQMEKMRIHDPYLSYLIGKSNSPETVEGKLAELHKRLKENESIKKDLEILLDKKSHLLASPAFFRFPEWNYQYRLFIRDLKARFPSMEEDLSQLRATLDAHH